MNHQAQAQLNAILAQKQHLEQEYSKLPITVNGKSMQVRKRKEELECELDQIEKEVYRIKQKMMAPK